MRWFSDRRRTGGRHNCITYLLTDMVAWPLPRLPRPHPFVDFLRSDSKPPQFGVWGPGGGAYDAKIRTQARSLYIAPNRQVSSSAFNRSEVIALTNKLTNKQTHRKHPPRSAMLRRWVITAKDLRLSFKLFRKSNNLCDELSGSLHTTAYNQVIHGNVKPRNYSLRSLSKLQHEVTQIEGLA